MMVAHWLAGTNAPILYSAPFADEVCEVAVVEQLVDEVPAPQSSPFVMLNIAEDEATRLPFTSTVPVVRFKDGVSGPVESTTRSILDWVQLFKMLQREVFSQTLPSARFEKD